MAKTFDISRVGHVGIQVTDFDRSLQWYTQTLGLTLTGKWPMGEDGAIAFMRFNEDHHNIVLFTHPTEVDDETKNLGYNGLQHIAMEVEDRDEWLKALADLRRKGVPIILENSTRIAGREPEYRLLDDAELLLTIHAANP